MLILPKWKAQLLLWGEVRTWWKYMYPSAFWEVAQMLTSFQWHPQDTSFLFLQDLSKGYYSRQGILKMSEQGDYSANKHTAILPSPLIVRVKGSLEVSGILERKPWLSFLCPLLRKWKLPKIMTVSNMEEKSTVGPGESFDSASFGSSWI